MIGNVEEDGPVIKQGPTTQRYLELLRRMILIRRFEERALQLLASGEIYGVVHPYIGQEAVAVGLCEQLRFSDKLITYHRGHGHSIAKGADIRFMMAELFGRADGCCKGKGGSMHIADFRVGMLGANGIVAAGIPHSVGAALAQQMLGTDSIVVVFFGDGATGQGVFYESLNLAALWSLPVVLVCDNNQYASGTPIDQILATDDITEVARSFGIPGLHVDGTDLWAVIDAANTSVERARAGNGPTLIECKSYRFAVHAQRIEGFTDPRSPEEVAAARQRDPISLMTTRLEQSGLLTSAALDAIEQSVENELAEAVDFARNSPFPSPEAALEDLFAD